MKKVNLHFKFVRNQFIQQVKEIMFETKEVDLADYQDPNDMFVYEGDLNGIWIIDDLDILVNCRGLTGFTWSLEVTINGKKLTEKPIEGKINSKGVSFHYESYKLP